MLPLYTPPSNPPAQPPPGVAIPSFLEPEVVTALGRDFRNPRYDPTRIGKALGDIDTDYDYDFAELASVQAQLQGVDRRSVLRLIFDKVTAGAQTDTDRHLAVLYFLQSASVHSAYLEPIEPDGSMVSDPLVLLALNEMRCSHVARLAVDIFDSAGYPGRLVWLGNHDIAEIQYGGRWHYFDADLFGGGQVVRDADGTIPSVAWLSQEAYKLDAIPAYLEEALGPGTPGTAPLGSPPYPGYYYFSSQAYQGTLPQYVLKMSDPTMERESSYYGWENIVGTPARDIQLADFPVEHQSGAPTITAVARMPDGRVQVTWMPSADSDDDLDSYVVYVGSRSRGFDYASVVDDPAAAPFWTGGYVPSMYPNLFLEPPHDLGLVSVPASSCTQSVARSSDPAQAVGTVTSCGATFGPVGSTLYISIAAFDGYGKMVGRVGGLLSHQLKIDP